MVKIVSTEYLRDCDFYAWLDASEAMPRPKVKADNKQPRKYKDKIRNRRKQKNK